MRSLPREVISKFGAAAEQIAATVRATTASVDACVRSKGKAGKPTEFGEVQPKDSPNIN